MAEQVEMQSGMLSWVGPGNILHRDVDAPTGTGTFGMSGPLAGWKAL